MANRWSRNKENFYTFIHFLFVIVVYLLYMKHNNFYMSNTESTVLVIIVAFDSLFLDLIKAKENPAVKKKMLQKEVL